MTNSHKKNTNNEETETLRRFGFWAIIGILVAGVIIYFMFSYDAVAPNVENNGDETSDTVTQQDIPVTLSQDPQDDDWSRGNLDADVTIVEYSDFQCPACGLYEPLVEEMLAEQGDNVRFIYRNFPLSQIHINAQIAAQAAEAAGLQGKFWEMHDRLFATQSEWSDLSPQEAITQFTSYAKDLGVDIAQFNSDIASQEVVEAISNDYNTGSDSNVQGTPTFFINGKEVKNPRSIDDFVGYIENAQAELPAAEEMSDKQPVVEIDAVTEDQPTSEDQPTE